MDNGVNKDMSISQVLNLHRGTARIFMEFGMTCLGCPHATAESLEEACAAHGANVDELVHQLNEFLAQAQ
jgi:hybrid cluster-associated redox disulfide protein